LAAANFFAAASAAFFWAASAFFAASISAIVGALGVATAGVVVKVSPEMRAKLIKRTLKRMFKE
jgi:hypothetical protein